MPAMDIEAAATTIAVTPATTTIPTADILGLGIATIGAFLPAMRMIAVTVCYTPEPSKQGYSRTVRRWHGDVKRVPP
jgi:hypothetical protein